MTATMKKLLILFSVAALGLSLTSCSDFLEEKVTTSLGTAHCYNTEAALTADVYGVIYKFGQAGFMYGPMNEWTQPASGVLHWGNSNRIGNARYQSMLDFTRYANHDTGSWIFGGYADAAYLANSLLGSLEKSEAPQELKDQIEGEGRYFRAISYFALVRTYGDITFVEEPPKTIDDVCQPRRPFWECYNFILEDLTKAYELMPDFPQMLKLAGGNASGFVCNYGALALRSLVYLTIGTLLEHPNDNFWVNRTPEFIDHNGAPLDAKSAFEHALADAEEVINNGPFELAPSFAQLFRWGGRDRNHPGEHPEDFQLKERIFVLPRTAEGISNTSLASWHLPPYYNGNSSSTASRTLPTRWLFQNWCAAYGGIKGTDKDNSNIYVDCGDPRMKASLAYDSYIGKDNEVQYIYPHTGKITGASASSSKNNKENIVYNIKYYDATFNSNTGLADVYVMRYAEVFLIAAEAAAYLSSAPGDAYGQRAINHINTILTRARKSGDIGEDGRVVLNYAGTGTCTEPANWTAGKFADKEALLTAIFWERMFELDFECHEYYDTHRCGAQWLADHIAKPKNAFLDLPEQDKNWITYNYGLGRAEYNAIGDDGTFRYITDPVLLRKSLICSYPEIELQANTELDITLHDPYRGQNPQEVCWE